MSNDPEIDKLVQQIVATPDPDVPGRYIVTMPQARWAIRPPGEQAEIDFADAVYALVKATPLDDDQDPALDTAAQAVVRAHNRWRALTG